MPRVLVVGLDGADSGLLMQWAQAGILPVLQSLLSNGCLVPLSSPEAMGDDATWASFSTACTPGTHGRYFYKKLVPGSYATPMFRGSRLAREPFWGHLSTHGQRVAILDVPKTPLAADVNGVQLVDWQVHGPDLATHSHPVDLADTILQRFGGDRVDRWHGGTFLCGTTRMSTSELDVFQERLVESARHKTAVAEELLERERWDLFLVVFKESHCIGHQCWHLHDDLHHDFPPALRARYGDPILRIYRELDSSIGRILGHVEPQTQVLIFTDLGMRSNITAEHLLDDVLMRLEWGKRPVLADVYRTALGLQKKFGSRLLPDSSWGVQRFRRAYQVPHNEISGAIRINLQGREPHGRVRPGRELEEFLEQLTADLMELRESASGQPAVKNIVRTDRRFPGAQGDRLPDLLVEWERSARIDGLSSPKIGVVSRESPGYRSGNHVSGGMLLATGPGIRKGRGTIPASIMDLGPTVADLLDCPLDGVDGTAIDLFGV